MGALSTSDREKHGGDSGRNVLLGCFLFAFVLLGWSYFETFQSIVEKWDTDSSFSHGFLVPPIAIWLAWRLRGELVRVAFRPSMLGSAAVMICVLLWVIARGTGVLVIEQFAAVAMIPSLVLAAFGPAVVKVLAFPLAFLMFMVPFGRGLVPYLMYATADAAILLLQWTGIPVLGSHMYITIPYGRFEVARACSGLNYFVTSLVLGTLYAYLIYRKWTKRVLCVAAFLVFPVFLNILRVYIIVMVSYLTEFRFGPGQEHVVFGRVFFLVVILVMFWVGRRWQDEPARTVVASGQVHGSDGAPWPRPWPLAIAVALVLSGPPFARTSVANMARHVEVTTSLVEMPIAPKGWSGPEFDRAPWRPEYRGGVIEQQASYLTPDGAAVDAFVAVYGLGISHGAEMISYQNVVSPSERGSLAKEARRVLRLADGSTHQVRELTITDQGVPRLVWHWYVVGESHVTSPYQVKALEALAIVTRAAKAERVVTVSTVLDDAAPSRLETLVVGLGHCAIQGFQVEACGG